MDKSAVEGTQDGKILKGGISMCGFCFVFVLPGLAFILIYSVSEGKPYLYTL